MIRVGETHPQKKPGPTYVQLSKLMIINLFFVLVMFKGGRFWTLHLADLGLMTMLQVADMVWEFPFNWYLRLISGKSSIYLKSIHVRYPFLRNIVAVVVHLFLLRSDVSFCVLTSLQWWCVPLACSKRLLHTWDRECSIPCGGWMQVLLGIFK